MKMIAKLFVNALALLIVSAVVPGIVVTDLTAAVLAALAIGVVNVLVKPVLILLTLPISIVTLGLFVFVINAALLLLVGSIVPGFQVDGFVPALIGSVVLSVVSTILQWIVR